jgi:hypothetical protein
MATGVKVLPLRFSTAALSGPALNLVLRVLSTRGLLIIGVLLMIVELRELLT